MKHLEQTTFTSGVSIKTHYVNYIVRSKKIITIKKTTNLNHLLHVPIKVSIDEVLPIGENLMKIIEI